MVYGLEIDNRLEFSYKSLLTSHFSVLFGDFVILILGLERIGCLLVRVDSE